MLAAGLFSKRSETKLVQQVIIAYTEHVLLTIRSLIKTAACTPAMHYKRVVTSNTEQSGNDTACALQLLSARLEGLTQAALNALSAAAQPPQLQALC